MSAFVKEESPLNLSNMDFIISSILMMPDSKYTEELYNYAKICHKNYNQNNKKANDLIGIFAKHRQPRSQLNEIIRPYINQISKTSDMYECMKTISFILNVNVQLIYQDSKQNVLKVQSIGLRSWSTIRLIYRDNWFILNRFLNDEEKNLDLTHPNKKLLNKSGACIAMIDLSLNQNHSLNSIFDNYIGVYSLSNIEAILVLKSLTDCKACFICNSGNNLIKCSKCSIFFCNACIKSKNDSNFIECKFCNSKIRGKSSRGTVITEIKENQLALFDANISKCDHCINVHQDCVFFCSKCGSLGIDGSKIEKCKNCGFFPAASDDKLCMFCIHYTSN